MLQANKSCTDGLTLFPGTPLLEEADRGEFTPLTERELIQKLLTFLEAES